ncbi:RNA-processing protein [Candidatus Micrarchaeota archaeon]|nr:RNA-processing protein [Candidatus Micrarchaeota archaeon]
MKDEFATIINIPRERIAVLIGPNGSVKKKLEKETGVKITVDSKTGEVEVVRPVDVEDQLTAIKSEDVIRAIARGFSPQKAFKLLLPEYYLEIIDLTEHVTDKSLERVRSRLIGREGKSRSFVSRMSSAEIVIYGKTVSIVGDAENVDLAKQAVMKIIHGLPHSAVFRFLERKRI